MLDELLSGWKAIAVIAITLIVIV